MPIVASSNRPEVVAVLPTMGLRTARLDACIESLIAGSAEVRLAIIVVSNSSTADPGLLGRDEVEVLAPGLNLGWAGGLAYGAARTSSPFLWWMQDDVVVEAGTLAALRQVLLDDPDLACSSPVQIDEDGRVPAGSCGGMISDEGVLGQWLPTAACDPHELPDLSKLSYLPSRGLLVRRSAFDRVGGPNVRLYPAQFVDADFAFRLRSHGLSQRAVTAARLRHSGSASTPAPFAQFLHSRNAGTFAATWFPDSAPPPDRYFPVSDARPDPPRTPTHPIDATVSRDLIDAVAQSASDVVTHLGRTFARQDAENHTRAARDAAAAEAREDRLREMAAELAEATSRLAEMHGQRDAIAHELHEVSARSAAASRSLDEITASRSWRITAPLRTLSGLVRRR